MILGTEMIDQKTTPFLLTMLLILIGIAGLSAQEKINWITWEQAETLSQEAPRKVVVDVYTEWCGWCKKMDKSTFQDENVAEYINKNYYAIKFDAEQKEEIELNDRIYKYVRSGTRGYHELAAKITFGKLSYPTIVFLDEDLDVIQPIAGYKDAEKFGLIMTYFGEDHHKKTPWKQFCNKNEN